MTRRVVTGLDEEGRSAILIEGEIPRLNAMNAALAWKTDAPVADNSGREDAIVPYDVALLHSGGTNFAVCEFPPRCPAYMHATDTLDYLIILSGRVTLVLEEGEVALNAGDLVVDRGIVHGWRNDHDEPCVAMAVNLPAAPVGRGRTI
jgi:quercetin dioxygenase-like cupin family protein